MPLPTSIQPAGEFLELENDCAAIDAFVARENARSADLLADETFRSDTAAIRSILEDTDKLIHTAQRGDWLYSFERTRTNPRGVWRRIPAKGRPASDGPWESVFDLDAFCAREDRVWHWRGAVTAPFDPDRVLIALSDGGSDRWRFIEFNCETKAFVEDGFDLPAEKANVCWLGPGEILVCTSSDGGATRAGWPRVAKRLKRGTSLYDAPVVFEGNPTDVGIWAHAFIRGVEAPLIVIRQVVDLGKMALTCLTDDGARWQAETPNDAYVTFSKTHYAYHPRDEADPLCGALVVCSHGATRAGQAEHRVAFRPSERKVLDWRGVKLLGDWLVFTVEDNLTPSLYALSLHDVDAAPQKVGLPEACDMIAIVQRHAEPQAGDDSLQLYTQGLLQPPAVYWFDLDDGPAGARFALIGREPDRFDANCAQAQILTATSDDGTEVPYRLVLPKGAASSDCPVLMYAYGGFGTSVAPGYLGLWGKLWVERGGAYVLAHIRGGSEFGPGWHKSAMRENRPRAFEDFAAVARDLTRRGITQPHMVACRGASNGGLLTAVMLTRYPDLFGAIWSVVPLTDMLRFHAFEAGKAWIDEYGNPEQAEDRAWLEAYSPIHNVAPHTEVTYPPTYIETSKSDDRVDPSHAMRLCARLRAHGHEPLFHQFGDGGHGGGGSTGERARELAMGLAFLRQTIAAPSAVEGSPHPACVAAQ